tara:strand:+ start:397 stop:669 length:273 start_codon:yes stop_codon:yes gene_type:complete
MAKKNSKKARKRSRIPLSKRFKLPRKMAEDQIIRLLREAKEMEEDLYSPEQGIKKDSEGNIVEIGVASGGMIQKNYANGGGVRKAKFIDS